MTDWYYFTTGKPRSGCKAHLLDADEHPLCRRKRPGTEAKPAPDTARRCLECKVKRRRLRETGESKRRTWTWNAAAPSVNRWPKDIRPAVDVMPIEPGGPVHQPGPSCWCEPKRLMDEFEDEHGRSLDGLRHFNRGVG